MVRHRFLTPMLASTVVANAAQNAAARRRRRRPSPCARIWRCAATSRSSSPIRSISPDGVSPRTLAAATGLKAIGDILFNPFTPANLDRIDIDVDVDYKADVAEIVGVSLNSDELSSRARAPTCT